MKYITLFRILFDSQSPILFQNYIWLVERFRCRRSFFFRIENCWLKLQPKISTPKPKILATSLVAMPMTRLEFRTVPCLSGGNVSATCLKMLFMRFADVQWPAPLSLHSSCLRRSINVKLLLLLDQTLTFLKIFRRSWRLILIVTSHCGAISLIFLSEECMIISLTILNKWRDK